MEEIAWFHDIVGGMPLRDARMLGPVQCRRTPEPDIKSAPSGMIGGSLPKRKQESQHMKIIRAREFQADRAWGAMDIARMDGITTRLHWTDQPYRWHVNDGQEVFAVLDGVVEMRYRAEGVEKSTLLQPGDIFFADEGCEHVAHPRGPARVLVVEKEGSV